MNNILTTLIILLFTVTINAQNKPDCLAYKKGKFKVDGSTSGIITRTKKHQFEKSDNVNVKDKIVWLSECKYKLIPVKLKKDKNNTITPAKDWVLYFEIIETGKDYYIVKITNDKNDFTAEAKMIKL